MDFNVRANVKVAPTNSFNARDGILGKARPAGTIDNDDSLDAEAALKQFLKAVPAHHIPHAGRRFPTSEFAVRDLVQSIQQHELVGNDVSGLYRMLSNRRKIPAKLLKFHDHVRPGYVGTFTKSSSRVGFRAPFKLDTDVFNYDYDSDDDWDADADGDEDGEDLVSDKGDDDGNADGSSDVSDAEDDWMCADDEVEYEDGYDSAADDMRFADFDNSGKGEHSDSDVAAARRRIDERKRKAGLASEHAKKRRNLAPLVPVLKGPHFEQEIGEHAHEPVFKAMRIGFLNGE